MGRWIAKIIPAENGNLVLAEDAAQHIAKLESKLRAVRDEVDKMDRRIYSGSQWIPNEQHIRLKALLGD